MSEGVPGRFVGDRYHLVRELGRGGMGVVYLARDLRFDMDVAIKFRNIEHGDATLWLKREFRAIAGLRHPNLVELYELVATPQTCYFTMEYLPGSDPRTWVERRQPPVSTDPPRAEPTTRSAVPMQAAHTAVPVRLERAGPPLPTSVFAPAIPWVDPARVRTVLVQLAEGLAYLHARGVIHRDIKPSNAIVVDEDQADGSRAGVTRGVVKLLDFGLSLHGPRRDEAIARETQIVGTAAYLAPEYIENLVVGPAMDVYALGVVAYELCTGSPPFGGTMHVLARLHQRLEIPPVCDANPDLPPELGRVIDAMLGADPALRPTALDVVQRLTGGLSRPTTIRRARQFVGRDAERARLGAVIADPTPRARLVLVTGPSGVGKSALIDEVVGRQPRDQTLAWHGRCHERERVPYRAFDLIIDELATELAGDPQLARRIDHAGALARVFPVLAPLLASARDEAAAIDLRVERDRALDAVAQMFVQLLTAPRGIVVLDDLQWADDDSLDLLGLLVERIDRPLTVIASWTTASALADDAPASAAVAPSAGAGHALLERLAAAAEVIALQPMSEAELAVMIAGHAPQAAATQLAAAARRALGSPYLAELIGHGLGDAEVIDPQDAEARRLDRLTPQERAVAELAALAGAPSSFAELRALAELPSSRLQSVLRGLEDARIVRSMPATAGDPVFVFYHQRLREAARAAMPAAARRTLHARYATWFEQTTKDPTQLAYHWREAGDDPRAALAAIAAGEAAEAQLAWGLAADWYARAIELGDRTASVQHRHAQCLFLAGRLAIAARAFLAIASSEAEGHGDRWRVRAAEAYLKLGELEPGLAVLDGVLARRGVRRTQTRSVSLLRAAGVATRWLVPGPHRVGPVDDVLVAAYRVIASFLSTPYPIESFEYVLRGVVLAERSGDRAGHAIGMAMLSAYVATGSLGRFGDRAIANAHRLCVASGAPYPQMVAAGATGMLATLRGEWPAMRAAHEDAHQICRRLGLERSWEASFLRTYWALGEHYAGDPRRALELLAALADTTEDLWTRAMVGSCRGRALVLAGSLDEARGVAEELARSPAAQHGMSSVYRQVFLGELALAEHGWSRARALGDQLAQSARAQWLSTMPAISAMVDVITATADLGLARDGDRDAIHRARATARRLLRRGRASFYAATALRIAAQAERLLGHDGASVALLGRAAEVARVRGGRVDQLAIEALRGETIDAGALGAAIAWSTGGMIDADTLRSEH